MEHEIEDQIMATVDKFEVRLRKLANKMVAMALSIWIIVGTIGVSLAAPVYLVKQMMNGWTKEAQAAMERTKEEAREPSITVSERALQHQQTQKSYWGGNGTGFRTDIRNAGNTLNEARYLVRSAQDLAGH